MAAAARIRAPVLLLQGADDHETPQAHAQRVYARLAGPKNLVLVPGAKAPRLVTEDMVAGMPPGAVVVDISIDQGGCFETSHMTTHSDPTYVSHGVVHYCVGNMPGAVPRTSTYALTNVTIPYAVEIATEGLERAIRHDPVLALGVNVYAGEVTNHGVAEAHAMPLTPLAALVDGLV
jgi:alanine dehydrogenase